MSCHTMLSHKATRANCINFMAVLGASSFEILTAALKYNFLHFDVSQWDPV